MVLSWECREGGDVEVRNKGEDKIGKERGEGRVQGDGEEVE